MLRALQNLIVRISRTWWLYLLVVALTFLTLNQLMRIGAEFPAYAGGAEPFDLQNGLEAHQVYPQIAAYTDQARELYSIFTAIDFVFPFVAGLFMAATAAFALRNGFPRWYEALTVRNLLPLFMIGSAFDWLENVTILTTLGLYPAEHEWLPVLLVTAKRLKLACVMLGQGIMILLLLGAAVNWLRRRARRGAAAGPG